MAEAEDATGGLHEQTGVEGGGERVAGGARVEPGDPGEQLLPGRCGQDGGRLEQRAGERVESPHPFEHRVAHRRRDVQLVELAARPAVVGRHDVAALAHQLERLLDRQRQPAGAVVEQAHELPRHLVDIERRPDQGGGLRDLEGVEGHPVSGTGVTGAADEPQEGGLGAELGRPVGQHERERDRGRGQQEQQVDGHRVGVVGVVDHHHVRVERAHQLDQGPQLSVSGGGGVARILRWWRQPVLPLGEQRPQGAGQRRQPQGGDVDVAQRVDDRTQRVEAGHRRTGHGERPSAPRTREPGQRFGHQAGLSDARLALDHDDRRRVAQRGGDPSQLPRPAHERRTGWRPHRLLCSSA